MIEQTVQRWHQYLAGERPGGLDELLHDDVVFLSPIVFSPQRGKEVTKLYLRAAGSTLGGESDTTSGAPAAGKGDRGFRYVKEVWGGNHAFLEFETFIGDTYVNGIDILTVDDDGRIVEFKVMIRPLQAINLVHEQMRAMLASLAPPAPAEASPDAAG